MAGKIPLVVDIASGVVTSMRELTAADYLCGSASSNGDLTIRGTSHATKTSSYVNLQPDGGFVGIGMSTPTTALDVTGVIKVQPQIGVSTQLGIKAGSTYALNIQAAADSGYGAYIFHNAYLTSPGSAETYNWVTSHASYGSRGIKFLFGTTATGGILFFADAAAATADTSLTPTERMRLTNGGDLGLGISASIAARLHVVSTTEQLRAGYDGSNYMSVTVGNTGIVTLNAVGAGSSFVFSDSVKVNAAFGCNSATPQTAYASGGALAAYAAGANGLSSGAEMSALHALVVAMRAALVANGIMS